MLVGRVVDDEFGDDAQAAPMRLRHEGPEVRHLAVGRIDRLEVGDVVAVVAQRRRIEGQQPDRRDAQRLHVVEALHQAGEVADAVAVRILEGFHVQLVDDRVLVPVGLGAVDDAVGAMDEVLHERGAPGGKSRQMA